MREHADAILWGTTLGAMAAMFVASLAVPQAFGRLAAVFGVAFMVVARMQLLLYTLAAKGDSELLKAVCGPYPRRSPARG